MPRLPRFITAHPEITLTFVTRIGLVDFEREGIDAAIHAGQPDWPGTEFTHLLSEEVVAVASPSFVAQNAIAKPTDLMALPLLHLASRKGAWDHWFLTLGLPAKGEPGLRFEQFSMLAQACSAGLGVALMPEFLITSELQSGQLVPVVDRRSESTSAYYLAAPKARRPRPPLEAFRQWIVTEAQAQTPGNLGYGGDMVGGRF